MSDGSFSDFRDGYEAFGADVPVFSIMFGSADPTQLEELAEKGKPEKNAKKNRKKSICRW